jgi:hypothetical protein
MVELMNRQTGTQKWMKLMDRLTGRWTSRHMEKIDRMIE